MTWDDTKIYDLLVDCKSLAITLGLAISRRLDLGQPIDGYADHLYYLANVTFAIEERRDLLSLTGSTEFEDEELDQLQAIYYKILRKHNRYKGL